MCVGIDAANTILTRKRRLRNVIGGSKVMIGMMVKLVKIIFLKDGLLIRDSVIKDLGDTEAVFTSAFDDITMMAVNL